MKIPAENPWKMFEGEVSPSAWRRQQIVFLVLVNVCPDGLVAPDQTLLSSNSSTDERTNSANGCDSTSRLQFLMLRTSAPVEGPSDPKTNNQCPSKTANETRPTRQVESPTLGRLRISCAYLNQLRERLCLLPRLFSMLPRQRL
jgi:hypothetical protein